MGLGCLHGRQVVLRAKPKEKEQKRTKSPKVAAREL